MLREKFFTDVIVTYKSLLSTPEGKDLTLRDYCNTRHVAYRDFIKWASTSNEAAGLPEIVKVKRKSSKSSSSRKSSSAIVRKAKTPRLYPIQISDTSFANETFTSGSSCSNLRGIRIILPGGTSISIREGSGSDIAQIIESIHL